MGTFPPATFPPPHPFIVETDVYATAWIDEGLLSFRGQSEGVLVGDIVPSGFEAYARVFHPARRDFGPSIEESSVLRWSEVAAARGKAVHPEMQIEALIDSVDGHDYERWTEISVGGGEWFPPFTWLGATEALALASLLRPHTATPDNAWFMLWDGYGDLGRDIDGVPRAFIHPDRSDAPLGQLLNGTWALRHYLVFRGPLGALATWFRWRMEGPNYWWPDDRAWIVASEIDGFSTYVGASRSCIEGVLASPLLEALPTALNQRFDVWGDTINGLPE